MKRMTLALIVATTFLIASYSNAQEKSYGKYIHTVLLDDYLFVRKNTPLVWMVKNMLNDIWAGKMQVYKAENVWAIEYGQYIVDTTKPIVATTIAEIIKPYSRTDSFQDPNSGKYIQYTSEFSRDFLSRVQFYEEAVYDEKLNTLKLQVSEARFYTDVLLDGEQVPFFMFLVRFKED